MPTNQTTPVLVWTPPNWGPFVHFTISDESRARPLGLGKVVDISSAVERAQKRMQQEIERVLFYGMA